VQAGRQEAARHLPPQADVGKSRLSSHIRLMAPRIDLLTHSRNRAMNRLHTILLATGSLVLLGVTA